jgi:hypothetical protein
MSGDPAPAPVPAAAAAVPVVSDDAAGDATYPKGAVALLMHRKLRTIQKRLQKIEHAEKKLADGGEIDSSQAGAEEEGQAPRAQLDPCLSQQIVLHTLNTPLHPVNTGYSTPTRTPYPIQSAQVELKSGRV